MELYGECGQNMDVLIGNMSHLPQCHVIPTVRVLGVGWNHTEWSKGMSK